MKFKKPAVFVLFLAVMVIMGQAILPQAEAQQAAPVSFYPPPNKGDFTVWVWTKDKRKTLSNIMVIATGQNPVAGGDGPYSEKIGLPTDNLGKVVFSRTLLWSTMSAGNGLKPLTMKFSVDYDGRNGHVSDSHVWIVDRNSIRDGNLYLDIPSAPPFCAGGQTVTCTDNDIIAQFNNFTSLPVELKVTSLDSRILIEGPPTTSPDSQGRFQVKYTRCLPYTGYPAYTASSDDFLNKATSVGWSTACGGAITFTDHSENARNPKGKGGQPKDFSDGAVDGKGAKIKKNLD